jgi:farnesyl diphosphate synthase
MKLIEKSLDLEEMSTLQENIKSIASAVDNEIHKLLPKDNSTLSQAMRYSCLETKGKKLRPFLLIETAKLFGIELKDIISIAAATELVHVYTLIHDDLPAMDNDDFRRNKPSCHKQFNEATALLTGNALLVYGLELISQCKHIPLSKRVSLIYALTQTIGFNGTIKGQLCDIESKGQKLSLEDILALHKLKTGKLIKFSCITSTIITNCSQNAKLAIETFADNLGLIFQITDDLLDVKSKPQSNECNVVTVLGIKKTQELLKSLTKNAISSLEIFGSRADTLKALIYFILKRQA